MKILTALAMALALTASAAQAQESFEYAAATKQTTPVKALKYKEAYKKARKGDKPLLVLVSADWCPPCRQMKATTIPELARRKELDKFHFAMVDFDKEADIAKELIKGDQIQLPQLVMFEQVDGKWIRRRFKGIKTADQVTRFVAQSNLLRVAAKEKKTQTETK